MIDPYRLAADTPGSPRPGTARRPRTAAPPHRAQAAFSAVTALCVAVLVAHSPRGRR